MDCSKIYEAQTVGHTQAIAGGGSASASVYNVFFGPDRLGINITIF